MKYSASEPNPGRSRLLRELGAAVRARRTELGLTMRALAKAAGVSERFLVQLEAGEGNISVARLEDVAEALGTTGAELLAQATRPRVEAAAPSVLRSSVCAAQARARSAWRSRSVWAFRSWSSTRRSCE